MSRFRVLHALEVEGGRMFDEVTRKGTRWRVFWPEVDDLDGANEAIKAQRTI